MNKKSKKETNSNNIVEPVYKTMNQYVQYAIIVLMVFILYGNTIMHDYALDDYVVISDNSFTQKGLSGLKDIFSYDSFKGYGNNFINSVAGGRYRPFSIATFAIEKQLWGQNPHISHFINIILYALTCVLVFSLLSKLLEHYNKNDWFNSIPFIATLLFAAHPIHTEVIANIKCRDEIFALLFSLLSLWLIMKYLDGKSKLYIIFSLFCFFIALLSKEIAIIFVLIIPATIYFLTTHSPQKIIQISLPIILIAIIFIVIRQYIIAKTRVDNQTIHIILNYSFQDMNISEKWATIVYCLGMYLKLIFIPHPLTWDYYPYHIAIKHWSDFSVIISLSLYLSFVYFMIKGLKNKSLYSFCILIYILPLVITANIFFPIGAFMCERFLYISSLGFAILLAWILSTHLHKIKISPLLLVIPILCLYSFKTIDRNKAWKDGETLIRTDFQTSSNSVKSNSDYANILYNKVIKEPESEEKLKDCEEILNYELRADSICHDLSRTNFILGTLFGRYKNNYGKAIYHLKRAIQLDPFYIDSYQNLGVTYAMLKQYDNAKATLYCGLKISPQNIEMYKSLSTIYYLMGKQDSGAICVKKVKILETMESGN